MMSYIDVVVSAVPAANKQKYREQAARMAMIFRENGALQVTENWGTDVPRGKVTDFYMATKAEEGEVVCVSWIVWPDKAARDAAWGKMMDDERMKPQGEPPFDGKRMFWGGFEPFVWEGQS